MSIAKGIKMIVLIPPGGAMRIVCMYCLVYSPLVATSFLPEFPEVPGDWWEVLGQNHVQTTVEHTG